MSRWLQELSYSEPAGKDDLQRWEAHGIPEGGTARFAVGAVVDSLNPRRASVGSVAPSRGSAISNGTAVVDQEPIEREWKF